MVKLHFMHRLTLLSLPILGMTMISGCTRNYLDTSNGYVYHASNEQEFYQSNNGVYYYRGDDNRYHYGHRYYQDANNVPVNNNPLSVRVRSYLLADPQLRNQMISVRTDGNRVELMGDVNTPLQKQRAVEVTRMVPGVDYIDDDMTVKSKS